MTGVTAHARLVRTQYKLEIPYSPGESNTWLGICADSSNPRMLTAWPTIQRPEVSFWASVRLIPIQFAS